LCATQVNKAVVTAFGSQYARLCRSIHNANVALIDFLELKYAANLPASRHHHHLTQQARLRSTYHNPTKQGALERSQDYHTLTKASPIKPPCATRLYTASRTAATLSGVSSGPVNLPRAATQTGVRLPSRVSSGKESAIAASARSVRAADQPGKR